MDLKEQTKIVKAASEYADNAAKFLKSSLGRSPQDQDVVVFASALSSIFGSWVYHHMYSAADKNAADLFLNQILSQISASVRQRGTPVVLQITAKSTRVDEGPPKSSVADGSEKCVCITDASGHCPGCDEHIRATISKVAGFAEQAAALKTKGSCKICFHALLDPVFSSIIRSDKFKAMAPEVKDVVIAMIMQSASSVGIEGMPLSEKALAELGGAKG